MVSRHGTPYVMKIHSFQIRESLNASHTACTNLWEFSCGGWLSKHSLPPGKSIWNQREELMREGKYYVLCLSCTLLFIIFEVAPLKFWSVPYLLSSLFVLLPCSSKRRVLFYIFALVKEYQHICRCTVRIDF